MADELKGCDEEGFMLTEAERLFLWRSRKRMNQTQAARTFKRSRQYYSWMELGRRPVPKGAARITYPVHGREVLRLLRRRSGKTLEEIGRSIGVSRPTVMHFERETDPRLVEFWRGRGYPVLPPTME